MTQIKLRVLHPETAPVLHGGMPAVTWTRNRDAYAHCKEPEVTRSTWRATAGTAITRQGQMGVLITPIRGESLCHRKHQSYGLLTTSNLLRNNAANPRWFAPKPLTSRDTPEPLNQRVQGSSPCAPTIYNNNLRSYCSGWSRFKTVLKTVLPQGDSRPSVWRAQGGNLPGARASSGVGN